MSIGRFSLVITALLTQLIISVTASELGPQGVSPGTPDRVARIDGACPTFIWEATPGAQRYEVVVYWFDNKAPAITSFELSPDNEVLFTMVSGRATGWTPESGDCFSPGETYAWFVRAVMDAETGEGSEWSGPRFFEVAAAPSAGELERAIEVIRRWQAATGDGSPTLSADAAADAVAVADSGTGSGSGSGSTRTKSVVTGTAAIRGEQPDLSGETYGVVGTSASPDGAGIGAANTAGGPDLVLDGAVPAELSESGVNRPSASPQTFGFTNTGGGGMMLDIEGIPVVTTSTDQDTLADLAPCATGEVAKWTGAVWDCTPDLDTDTLEAISPCGTGEIAKWTGSSWVCSPDIDTNTDTLAAISPCSAGEVAKWNGSTWDCAPDADTLAALNCDRNEIAKWNDSSSVWECSSDNNTTYSFGPGLILDGDQIQLDPDAFSLRVTRHDLYDDVGQYTSIAIGADGLGLISYHDNTNGELRVAHCQNIACTSATITTLDSWLQTGKYTSIAIGADGLGLISYHEAFNGELRVAHCSNTACTSASPPRVIDEYGVGQFTSITIGADGLPVISYYDYTNEDLMVAHCGDPMCFGATTSTLDSGGNVGLYTSIAIGADGLPLISYYDSTNYDLKVAHCTDHQCTSSVITTIHNANDVGQYSSITVGSDGLGLVSYDDASYTALMVAHLPYGF